MSPAELEQYLRMEPMPRLRLTLASGDQIVITSDDEPFVSSLALVLRGDPRSKDVTADSRLVSIPNIVLAEPVAARPMPGRRRRS
jgi:hypothetical protein